jgi:hypothetical protein
MSSPFNGLGGGKPKNSSIQRYILLIDICLSVVFSYQVNTKI